MAKNANDLILRDRFQFDIVSTTGDTDTVYGRFNLQDFVSVVDKEGLEIKEIMIQLRNPSRTPTGAFNYALNEQSGLSSMRIVASTTAYENLSDVGIASPDVLYVQDINYDGRVEGRLLENQVFTPSDLHPDGYTVISDLLIGVAADNVQAEDGQTVELDVMIIASPVKVTQSRLTEMLTQGIDL